MRENIERDVANVTSVSKNGPIKFNRKVLLSVIMIILYLPISTKWDIFASLFD